MEAMIEAAVQQGISREVAQALCLQTALGLPVLPRRPVWRQRNCAAA